MQTLPVEVAFARELAEVAFAREVNVYPEGWRSQSVAFSNSNVVEQEFDVNMGIIVWF